MTTSRRLLLPLLAAAPLLLAGAAHADPYAAIAKALTKKLGADAGKKAAVVPFAWTDGRPGEGGTAVAAALQTALVGRGLVIVERAQLEKLLEELHLQKTGAVGTDSAMTLGRMAGAELLVTGTLTESGRKVEVNARLIRVESGEVVRAAKEKVEKTWRDGAPEPSSAAGGPPAAPPLRFSLSTATVAGTTRVVDGRKLAFRYADLGQRPAIRITDYTGERPEFVEVPFDYHPGSNFYKADEPEDFRLAGSRYRLWADAFGKLHIAPRRGLLGETVEEQEYVILLDDVFKAWLEDVSARSRELKTVGIPGVDGRRLRAYFEQLPSQGLRVSLLAAEIQRDGGERLVYKPLDVVTLKGHSGRAVDSRLLYSGREAWRFHYDADAREVSAEEVR